MSPSEAFDLANSLDASNAMALLLTADEARFMAGEYADRHADADHATAAHEFSAIEVKLDHVLTAIRADAARRNGPPAATPQSRIELPPAAEPPAVKPAAAKAKSKKGGE